MSVNNYLVKDNELPDLAHELIRVAIKDLEQVEKMSHYMVSMGSWHVPSIRTFFRSRWKECRVCLAGSVMAISLRCPIDKEFAPISFPRVTRYKLVALDCFRRGSIFEGLYCLDPDLAQMWAIGDVEICDYTQNPKKFKRDMLKLADNLEVFYSHYRPKTDPN